MHTELSNSMLADQVERKLLFPMLSRGITEKLGFTKLTEAQLKSLPPMLEKPHSDVILRAGTGTGKTLSYLVGCAQNSLKKRNPGISSLIIVPNRELGVQVERQAKSLLNFSNASVLSLLSGTSRSDDIDRLKQVIPEIVIATPGKLSQHLKETPAFASLLSATKSLVLDEADLLLSSGFSKDMSCILAALPRKKRSILVSATISDKFKSAAVRLIRPGYIFLDCEKSSIGTVSESFVISSGYFWFPALVNAINLEAKLFPFEHKILVFFPTCKSAEFAAELCTRHLKMPVSCLHGRMTSAERNQASSTFRKSRNGLLFTTDVSSRGLDYADVSLVIQMGAPSCTDTYTHRIGRTGRGGNSGAALIILHALEKRVLDRLKRGVKETGEMDNSQDGERNKDLNSLRPAQLTTAIIKSVPRLRGWESRDVSLLALAQEAHLSFLTYYDAQARFLDLDPSDIPKIAGDFVLSSGMSRLPAVPDNRAHKNFQV